MSVKELLDSNFEQFLKSSEWLFVDFWANWCGPCKMMAPLVEELSEEMNSKISFGKLDVDKNPDTAQKYGVTSMPTFVIFRKGEIVDRVVGAQSREALKQRIEQALQL